MAQKDVVERDLIIKADPTTVKKESRRVVKLGYTQEPNYITVEIEKLNFSNATGQKMSTPYLQSFDTREWPAILKYLPSQGFSFLRIINLPEGAEAPTLTKVPGQ